ncbi:nucleoside hydrolase [uncultured Draconibacterium sp.]|uniref:nucleoside hydrolase n=1 Tax=uncultured Draconibacterium sp. TaxID=1573823 RepID=UPI0025F2A507|nr:nucleoside hydrolase [uncultured Draconibacterium sp.]
MVSKLVLVMFVPVFVCSCVSIQKDTSLAKMKVLIDTDANNELDDQHALAYAFLNDAVFDVIGVTVNNTRNGYGIQGQYDEAERIIKLFNKEGQVPLFMGADKSYAEIAPYISENGFDGQPAVDFIIAEALKMQDEKLVLAPVGKLTNIALAILKEPRIIDKVRVVWLGGNYPDPGEYNLDNDTTAVNPVVESGVDFEMVTVRYGAPSGTSAVAVVPDEIEQHMRGKGPVSDNTIIGRHGGEFNRFGDYSANLFAEAEMYGNPPSRALFDMVVLAVLKNESWGEKVEIPAPKLLGNSWVDVPGNPNKIIYWQNFNRDAIVHDLFELMQKTTPKQ